MVGKRDPSSHRTPAQIRTMDRGYNSTPTMINRRSTQNAARSQMEKLHGKAALAGKDVDHKRPLRSGGSNSKSNLRAISRSRNRSWRDGV